MDADLLPMKEQSEQLHWNMHVISKGLIDGIAKLFDKSYSSLLHYKDFFNNNSNSGSPIAWTSNPFTHIVLRFLFKNHETPLSFLASWPALPLLPALAL